MSAESTPVPFLRGTRVYLRGLVEADCAGAYLSWFNDARVCEFNGHHVFPYEPDAARQFVAQAGTVRDALVLAIVEAATERHIGNIALQHIDYVSRSAEFAVVIGERDCWGKGYSTEAARLLLDHGFYTFNLNRVSCGTLDANTAMRRLAESLGMREEGRRREAMFKNNRYYDVIEYGVLKAEYEALGRSTPAVTPA